MAAFPRLKAQRRTRDFKPSHPILRAEELEHRCLPSYTFTTIDYPGAIETALFGINKAGQIVGYYVTNWGQPNPYNAFVYEGNNFTTIEPPGGTGAQAQDNNDAGQIAGDFADTPAVSGRVHGFLYRGGGYTTFDVPGATYTQPFGLNNLGQLVGIYRTSDSQPYQAFLRDAGGSYTTIQPSGATEAEAKDINDAGQIVGQFIDTSGNTHGFLNVGGTLTQFDAPGAVATGLEAINDAGQILGGTIDASGNRTRFLYTGGTITTIDPPSGATKFEPIRIDDAGKIVGWFADAAGKTHGFLATPDGQSQTITSGPTTAPQAPIPVNTAINTSAWFTDAITTTTHAALWNWGDGTPASSGIVTEANGSGSVTGSHTYSAAGVYTVTLTVMNNLGGSGQSTFQYVVVYDPSAGFVTGGGWITSPAGAYVANPSLTGKATFGFVSKYQHGANVPTGNTQFHFDLATLDFHSTSYDWLVVGGAKAQFKGSGQINNAGNDGFLLTAIDGALPGGGGQDKFRIKIWDKNTGNTIYDNQLGTDDTADPTTVIGGGNIIIHSSNQLLDKPPLADVNHEPLTEQQWQPLEREAVRRWVAAGADPAAFRAVQVQVVDLPGSGLGLAAADTIWLDRDAAGHGWYLDPTPGDDSEFPAAPGSPAAGKVDLLTVLAHELGHVLGFEDTRTDGLMAEYLGTGMRRVPTLSSQMDETAATPDRAVIPTQGPSLGRSKAGVAGGSIDLLFALLAGPEAQRRVGVLAAEGIGSSNAELPHMDQQPVALTATQSSGGMAGSIEPRQRVLPSRLLDTVFADLKGNRLVQVFEDSLAAPMIR